MQLYYFFANFHFMDEFLHHSLQVCQYLITNMENKNPATLDADLWTPLHFAARFGHHEICR